MTRPSKTMNRLILYSKFSALSAFSAVKYKSVLPVLSVVEGIRVTCLEQPVVSKVEPCRKNLGNLWFKNNLFEKTNPIFPRFQPKNRDSAKFKPNSNPIKPNSNPIQTQFFGLKMNNLVYPVIFLKNTVLICVNQCLNIIRGNSWLKTIPFLRKRTQTSLFPAQNRGFSQKTNPKRTQTKPNCLDAKMNVYPLLTKYYEIL